MKLEKLAEGSELKKETNALRICLTAEGQHHLAVGCRATSTWDTAGPDAVLRAAGGVLINHETGQPMTYGKEAVVMHDGVEYPCANPPYIGGDLALLRDFGIAAPGDQHRLGRRQ